MININAIVCCIDTRECNDGPNGEMAVIAREQLSDLVTEIGRLKSILGDALSKVLISVDGVNLVEENASLVERCATLEQQVKDTEEDRDEWMQGSKLWEADARGDAFQHNSILRKEIEQQAERKGYELAKKIHEYSCEDMWTSYDEAIAERDGGAK